MQFQHPYLNMSQIYSALAYYWDNKQELDADIERREEYAERSRQEAGESPFLARLRSQGIVGEVNGGRCPPYVLLAFN